MNFARSFLSLTLMVAVLLSGSGFTVSQHYCLGHLQSEQFFGEADSCFAESSCEADPLISFQNQDCCEDIQLSVEGISFEVPLSKKKQLQEPFQYTHFTLPDLSADAAIVNLITPGSGNDPPHLLKTSRSILIAVQRFLI